MLFIEPKSPPEADAPSAQKTVKSLLGTPFDFALGLGAEAPLRMNRVFVWLRGNLLTRSLSSRIIHIE
jgi:hypothetical protein